MLDSVGDYSRALRTMREVVEVLRDQPDPDGALSSLIERIEAERAWVTAELRLGLPPQQPPGWVADRVGGRCRADAALLND